MDLSRPTAPSRPSPLGLGFVVAVHLVAFWALGTALVKDTHKPATLTSVRIYADPWEFKESPIQPLKPEAPRQKQLDVPAVPVPEVDIVQPSDQRTGITTRPADTTAKTDGPPTGGSSNAVEQAKPQFSQRPELAGAVCTIMPRPEVPAVAWSGEALLHVTATVKAGRVVASELQFTRSGLDGRTRRSLQHSVESALASYQCPGDHVFEQDFAFRLE